MDADVLYIRDVARKLGKTVEAVRSALSGASSRDAVPKPFRLGGRLAWRRVDFDAWLKAKAEEG